MSRFEVYAPCDICKQVIHVGEPYVSIIRNLEVMDDQGVVTVQDSVQLATLCSSCGARNPEGAIGLNFVGREGR
jgi:hypothetical protein